MKYIIILGDGMADEPVERLSGLTPLQAAETPYMDMLAARGRSGMLDTIPEGFSPGSEIANLSVLGYDVAEVYEGRGSLEAASMGIKIDDGETAMRCNLITVEDGRILNHSAGHISSEEAAELMRYLQSELGGIPGPHGLKASFHPGVSYRHLLKIVGGDKRVVCHPPHDHLDEPFADLLPKPDGQADRNVKPASEITDTKESGDKIATPQSPQDCNHTRESGPADTGPSRTAAYLRYLILESQRLLARHPVNLRRIAEGKKPANSIWPWSPGYRPRMETLPARYGLGRCAVISAVDLIKGIGVYAGAEVIEVEGATGLHDTNYEGKAAAALEALRDSDFVFLHIEASDEAGHEGDAELKVKTIEYLDRRVLKTIVDEVSTWDESVRIAVLPDHPTPCAIRTHTAKPVPFLIWDRDMLPDAVTRYDEEAAREGSYGLIKGGEFMKTLLS
ncbi:MAG: cofactor-independent phosphoglycerate mutase [Alistipes sp.]|nr:cofactor-independent phosphoglycerate mutase [Alistipes sp.]